MTQRRGHGKKLLIASIGVAAVSWVACGGDDSTGGTGNSGGSSTNVGGSYVGVGNLMGYPSEASTAGSGGAGGAAETDAATTDAPDEKANTE